MKSLWCWRCHMEIPMLNEEEYSIAHKLYVEGFHRIKQKMTREEAFLPMLDYYNELTGFEETEPNAIMHHRISQYGPPCESCGKPYRTPKASFCAACGHKRLIVLEVPIQPNIEKKWWKKWFGFRGQLK